MIRTHCDNCDVVIGGPEDPHPLRTVLRDGTRVWVETVMFHPLTKRPVVLCAACSRALIASAVQPS